MNEYKLLSAIYEILGEINIETLEKIEMSAKQPDEILNIIRSLKSAKIANSKNGSIVGKKEKSEDEKSMNNLVYSYEKLWSSQAKKFWDSMRAFLNENKKIKNNEIIEAFKKAGLDTNTRSKEGRKNIMIKIESKLNKIDDSKRIKILENVFIRMGFSQTKGYVEAIKSRDNFK